MQGRGKCHLEDLPINTEQLFVLYPSYFFILINVLRAQMVQLILERRVRGLKATGSDRKEEGEMAAASSASRRAAAGTATPAGPGGHGRSSGSALAVEERARVLESYMAASAAFSALALRKSI